MPRSLKYPLARSAPVVPAAPSLAFAIHVVERLTPRDRWLLRLHMAKLVVWAPTRKASEVPRASRRDRDLDALKWKAKR